MEKPRILLGDDHGLIQETARSVLEPEFEIADLASNGLELVEQAARLRPDAVVLDISMPLLNGLEAARRIKQTTPEIKLLFVTQKSEREFVRLAFQLGASGYMLKQSLARELRPALREVLAGRLYVTQAISCEVLCDRVLTPRQQEVLQLLAQGTSLKETAAALDVSMKTIEFHQAALMEKLGLHSRAELSRYAAEHGKENRAG